MDYGAGDSENPYQAPADYTGTYPGYGAATAAGTITPTLIDMGEIFSRTWAVFKDQWGMCLVVLIVCWVINFVVGMVAQWGGMGLGFAIGSPEASMVFAQLGNFAAQLFAFWIGIGQALFFVKTARGQEASFGDIFAGGPYLLRVLGASILLGCGGLLILGVGVLPGLAVGLSVGGDEGIFIGVVVAMLVAGIPLVIYGLVFSQYYYLIIDHNAGAIESLGLSREVTRGNRLMIFAIGLIAGLASVFVVLFTCGVGILAVGPYMALLYPVMYLGMIGQPVAPAYQTQ